MRLENALIYLSALVAVASCTPRTSPDAQPSVSAPDGVRGRTVVLPETWSGKDVGEARASLRAEVAAEAFDRAVPPASLAYRPTDRTEFSYDNFSFGSPIASGSSSSERVEIHDMVLIEPPLVSLDAPSSLGVAFNTLMPIRSAKLYVGALVQGDRFRKPVFRATVDHELEAPATNHRLTFDLARLLGAKYDIQEVSSLGRGVVAFRIEIQVPGHVRSGRKLPGRVYVEDGRLAFRCGETPCDLSKPLTQLPTISLGPTVDLVTPSSATISWLTDVPTIGRVIVRDQNGRERTFTNLVASARHEIPIDSVQPGRAHRYLALSCDVRGECVHEAAGTFVTPTPDDTHMSFALMSDSRASSGTPMSAYQGVNRDVIEQLFSVATQHGIDFAIFAGDLITGYVTQDAEYRRQIMAWQQATEPFAMHLPIYEGIGNHEFLGDAWASGWLASRQEGPTSETVFAELVVNPKNAPAAREGEPSFEETVFSFDRGVAHFTVLNSNYFFRNRTERDDHPGKDRGGYREGWLTEEQLTWLDSDLAAARAQGAKHLFVFTHEPAFPNGGHVQDAMWYHGQIPEVLEQRDAFLRILLRHKVLAVFFGDEHNYSRTRIDRSLDAKYDGRLWQIISGGAGAPYYARDNTVPWARNVESFEPMHHVVLVDIEDDSVWLRAVTTQGETVDKIELTAMR